MAAPVDSIWIRCAKSRCQWSWIGFLLITTQIGLSTEQFSGFNCTDVCRSLLNNSNWLYLTLELANNSMANDSRTTPSFCETESGATGAIPNISAPTNTSEIDIGLCSSVFENYLGMRVIWASLNASLLSINIPSCMRACATCKVDLQCSFSRRRNPTCDNVTLAKATDCTRRELGIFQSEAELRNTTLRAINDSNANYGSVLDRVVPGVLIGKGDKPICRATYEKWLCRTKLPILLLTVQGELITPRPCLEVCWEVLVECPFFLPAQLQYSTRVNEFLEEQYAGTPVFDCPRVDLVRTSANSRYRVCSQPPSTGSINFNFTCL